jgi:hypothetical protein
MRERDGKEERKKERKERRKGKQANLEAEIGRMKALGQPGKE